MNTIPIQPRDRSTELERITALTIKLSQRNSELRAAIWATINENLRLADGDNCTLKRLKDAVGYVDQADDLTFASDQKITLSAD